MKRFDKWLAVAFLVLCCCLASACEVVLRPIAYGPGPEGGELTIGDLELTVPANEAVEYHATGGYCATQRPHDLTTDQLLGIADKIVLVAWCRVWQDPRLTSASTTLMVPQVSLDGAADNVFHTEMKVPVGIIYGKHTAVNVKSRSLHKEMDVLGTANYNMPTSATGTLTISAADTATTMNVKSLLSGIGWHSPLTIITLSADNPITITASDGTVLATDVTSTSFQVRDEITTHGYSYKVTSATAGTTVTLSCTDELKPYLWPEDTILHVDAEGNDLTHYAVTGEWRLFAFELAPEDVNGTVICHTRMVHGDGTIDTYMGEATHDWGNIARAFLPGKMNPMFFMAPGAHLRIGPGLGMRAYYVSCTNGSEEEITVPIKYLTFGHKAFRTSLTEDFLRTVYIRDRAEMMRRGIWDEPIK